MNQIRIFSIILTLAVIGATGFAILRQPGTGDLRPALAGAAFPIPREATQSTGVHSSFTGVQRNPAPGNSAPVSMDSKLPGTSSFVTSPRLSNSQSSPAALTSAEVGAQPVGVALRETSPESISTSQVPPAVGNANLENPPGDAPSTAAVEPAAELPFAFVDPGSDLNKTQKEALTQIRDGFTKAVGGPSQNQNDPAYLDRWQQAAPSADELYRLWFGSQAAMTQQYKANMAAQTAE